jgi:hypothetical protein
MGNTLSPILADIYMDHYLAEHLHDVNQNNTIWRCVDDILIITKLNEQELNNYVNELNDIRGSIRFTYEYEQNNKINFLDTTLTRINKENQIKIKSCHGKSMKTNIVKNMATRIIQTTEDIEEQKED